MHLTSTFSSKLDAARQIVREVTEHPDTADEMSELLMERISSLNVDMKKARVYLTTLVSEQNAVYMVIMHTVDESCYRSSTLLHPILFGLDMIDKFLLSSSLLFFTLESAFTTFVRMKLTEYTTPLGELLSRPSRLWLPTQTHTQV